MQNSELSIGNLQARVEVAFSDVASPSFDNIIEHNCPECRTVRRVFKNEDWRTIEPKKVYWAFGELPLFTPEAFQFFLPAFIIYSLREPKDEVCQFLVYALASEKESNEWWQKRFDKFTEAQKSACNLFLRWLLLDATYSHDAEDINRALETWWKTEDA